MSGVDGAGRRASFELPGSDPLPGLDDLGAVVALVAGELQRVTVTYLDTPDLRLARAGVALRRRTGGSGSGWLLSLPGPDAEVELRRPPGRSARAVPDELSALLRARIRDGELGPVLYLRSDRQVTRLLGDDAQVLAELSDDRVTASRRAVTDQPGDGQAARPAWREVGVTLVEGDVKLLKRIGKRLRRAGARQQNAGGEPALVLAELGEAASQPDGATEAFGRDSSSGEVALGYLRRQIAELGLRDPLVRLDLPDAVHRMRVATRRMRSALATFRPLFDAEVAARLRDELAWLATTLGAARDVEVIRDRLLAQLAELPADLVHGPIEPRIRHELDQAYRGARSDLQAALDGPRYLALLDALDSFVADPPLTDLAGKPASGPIRRRLRHALRRVERALAAAEAAETSAERDTLLHELRKAAKRARYAGESVTEVFGSGAASFAARMETVHDILGRHQDGLMIRGQLLDLARIAQAEGESAFTYGVLHGMSHCDDGDALACLASSRDVIEAAGRAWPHPGARL